MSLAPITSAVSNSVKTPHNYHFTNIHETSITIKEPSLLSSQSSLKSMCACDGNFTLEMVSSKVELAFQADIEVVGYDSHHVL